MQQKIKFHGRMFFPQKASKMDLKNTGREFVDVQIHTFIVVV